MSLHPLFAGILSAHTGAGYAEGDEVCLTCGGSGEASKYAILDCTAPGCYAAAERNALMNAVIELGVMSEYDLVWWAYQQGIAKAQKVA